MSPKPRIVVAVANGITGDSRVQKSAIAAARDGWEVFLVGTATGMRVKHSTIGPIQVIRVPITASEVDKRQTVRGYLTSFRLRDKASIRRSQDFYHRRNAYLISVSRWLRRNHGRLGFVASKAVGLGIRVHRAAHKVRTGLYTWGQKRDVPMIGDWRKDHPHLVDLGNSIAPVIEELKPDLIHANDITMLNVVPQAVAGMRSRGEQVRWFYDAHEYVRGVEWLTAANASAFPALEEEFIRQADAVSTVSPEIAELIADYYGLAEVPVVIRNTPLLEVPDTGGAKPSVRAACGLPDDTKLLVYSGWISAERGIPTVIEALPKLPDCHFAIVAGRSTPVLNAILRLATELGVRDRVHVVPYVPQHLVPAYLSTADLGIICSKRSLNYENSLPTKLAEYIHGGLPVIVNDLKALSAFVRENGIGEVFNDGVDDFVAAVTRGLARRKELASNITEPILRELSWEHQSELLLQLYRDVSLVAPPQSAGADVSWTIEEAAPAIQPVTGPLAPWRPLGGTEVRLGLGPANYAGQAGAFAQAICREDARVSAEVFMRRTATSMVYPADVYLDETALLGPRMQIAQVKRIVGRYTHLIADAFLPVFGNLYGSSIAEDLPLLRQAGIKVALLAHGSDVRHPDRHSRRHEHSYFRDVPAETLARLTARAAKNRRIAEDSGLPLFATTPDLLDDLPRARWAPLVVDVDAWASTEPVMQRPRPVVLHAPSARWTKGTEWVLPILTDLDKRGMIELQLAEGLAYSQMRERVMGADIVVDQFGSGSYGTLAVEAMAAGRPVVANISDSVSRVIGVQPPIVSATPDTLRAAIESLVDDRANAVRIGAASIEFARNFHDGRLTALAFGEFLGI